MNNLTRETSAILRDCADALNEALEMRIVVFGMGVAAGMLLMVVI